MKKRLFSWIAYLVAMAVMLSSVFVMDMQAAAEGETAEELVDDEEEYDEEDEEDWDEEDYAIDIVSNFKATKITKNSVTLKWDKVEDIDGYEISYKKASAGKWQTIEVESANKTSYIVKKLSVGTKYNFRVRAYIFYEEDDEDYEDEEEVLDEGVEYEEDDSYYEDEEDDYEEEDEEWDDYEYGEYAKMTLSTLNKKGEGDKAAESNTSEPPASSSVKVPVLKNVKSKAAKKVEVKWTKSAKATGYEIYISLKKDSGYKKVGTVKNNSKVNYTIKKLKSGKVYFVKVRAYVKSKGQYSYTKYSKVKKVKVK